MKALLKIGLAGLIVVSTYLAILRIAEHKTDALAGSGCYVLAAPHSSEVHAFDSFLDQLDAWGETGLAGHLRRLQETGHLWVAPHLPGDRSAITVKSLGLVARVFIRRDELVSTRLPFPDLDVPREAQHTFAEIRLGGTLYHELLHYDGLEDEGATYDREIAWYRRLHDALIGGLHGEQRRWFEWAVDSATRSAEAARAQAVGESG